MIKELSIQHIAIAESVEVEFDSGLNIVTGETGAGKSLLVDALALLRGGRVDTSLIRTGHETAQVTGVFVVPESSELVALLQENGVLVDDAPVDEIIVRRVIQRNGRHRSFINDVPVSARTMQTVSGELIDISSQFENQRLLEAASHATYLDAFAGATETAARTASLYREVLSTVKAIFDAERARDLRVRERDLCEFELGEIEEAALNAEEFAETEEVLQLGKKTNAAQSLCQETLNLLSEGEGNCTAALITAKKNLERLDKLAQGTSLQVEGQRADEALAAIENLISHVERIRSSFEVDEERLQIAEERIETYNKLLRKFGPGLDKVFAHVEECRRFLAETSNLDAEIVTLGDKAVAAIDALLGEASSLSAKRRAAQRGICDAIERELADLGMPKAKFVCEFRDDEPGGIEDLPQIVSDRLGDDTVASLRRIGAGGFEEVRFLLSANAGLDPQPIEKVASGGELSRVMLAIKAILFADDTVNVFVFDEIDTGISGGIASKVGRKLARFCATRQAIVVTHLPQVACFAGSHFVAKKQTRNGQACAQLRRVNDAERAQELAVMLSGETVRPESLAQAKALLSEAQARRGVKG
jgi:DNA repair protein RecN (Recombination protein N)